MSNKNIRESLEELNLSLIQMHLSDAPSKEKRDALTAKISELLSQEDLDEEDLESFHQPLQEVLEGSVLSFEENHPKISGIITGIENILGSIGI